MLAVLANRDINTWETYIFLLFWSYSKIEFTTCFTFCINLQFINYKWVFAVKDSECNKELTENCETAPEPTMTRVVRLAASAGFCHLGTN